MNASAAKWLNYLTQVGENGAKQVFDTEYAAVHQAILSK